MAYNPNLIFRYDGNVIEPAPTMSISKEPVYINDNFIGNKYIIDLKGYASSVLKSIDRNDSNIANCTNSLGYIENVLQRNGVTLEIYDTCAEQSAIVAVGSHVQSFSTTEGQWHNYIEYNCSIEFTDLTIIRSDGIGSVGINNDSIATQDPVMAELLLKIASYNDSWSFSIPENEAYLYYARISVPSNPPVVAREDYTQINVQYTIKANGKHFYNINNLTLAAWENAKIFVQYKLYNQIRMFRNGNLLSEMEFVNTNYNSLDPGNPSNAALTSSVDYTPVIPPIIDKSIANRYAIYNESISCSTSETEGEFSATYSCVLKRFDPSVAAPQHSIHTFTVQYDQTNDFSSSNRTITVNGSLQGMLPTNILTNINDGQAFVLPVNGQFLLFDNDFNSKFAYAWQDLITFIVNTDITDLRSNFKNVLSINYASLFPQTSNDSPCVVNKGYNFLYQILAEPKTLSIAKNYSQGTVDYTATFDTERSCAQERGFNNLTITEEDSVPVYAEHTIIGRTRGPLLQNLNTNKLKTITIKFDGVTRKGCVAGHPFSTGRSDLDPRYSGISADVCDTDGYVFLPPQIIDAYAQTEAGALILGQPLIRTSNNVTYNPVDGSYSIDRQYLVCPPVPSRQGCEL